MRAVQLFLLHLLLICAPFVSGATVFESLGPYKATYTATYNGLPISTTRTLDREGNTLTISMRAENFLGFISETEKIGTDKDGKLAPISYHYERSILGKKKQEDTLFDRATSSVTTRYKGKTHYFSDNQALFAPLSYQLVLAQSVKSGQTDVEMAVVHRGALRNYRFQVMENTKLETPIGTLDTVKVRRVRETDERTTFMWFARDIGFVPVKILQEEGGERYEMLISAFNTKEQ